MLDHLESLQSLPSNPHAVNEAVGNIDGARLEESRVGALPVDPNRIALDAVEYAKKAGGWSPEIIERFGDGNWSALTQKASGPELPGMNGAA